MIVRREVHDGEVDDSAAGKSAGWLRHGALTRRRLIAAHRRREGQPSIAGLL
jgi:hypothetical protein